MTFKIRLEFTFMCATLLGMLSIDKYETYANIVLLESGDTKENPNWLATKQISTVIGLHFFIRLADLAEDIENSTRSKTDWKRQT